MTRTDFRAEPADAQSPIDIRKSIIELSVFTAVSMLTAVLVAIVIACATNGNIAQAAENLVRQGEIAEMQAYISEHKGEPSAFEQSLFEDCCSSSLGIRIAATDSSEYSELVLVANKELSYLPDYIKSKFASDGWSFVISSEDLDSELAECENKLYEPGDEIVLGLTHINEKTIAIRPAETSIASACLHEMGHYIDLSLGYVSRDEAFRQVADMDMDAFSEAFPYNHLDVAEEMYAEAFKAYWKSPGKLAECCPALYEYFDTRF